MTGEANSTRFEMRASEAWLRELDDWRRKQPDIPGRAESIRRLVAMGIGAEPILVSLAKYLEGSGLNDPETKQALEQLNVLLKR